MNTRITDSPLYQHLWGTAEARQLLGEEGRLRGWLEVIVALARAQAAVGMIPASAACQIAEQIGPLGPAACCHAVSSEEVIMPLSVFEVFQAGFCAVQSNVTVRSPPAQAYEFKRPRMPITAIGCRM